MKKNLVFLIIIFTLGTQTYSAMNIDTKALYDSAIQEMSIAPKNSLASAKRAISEKESLKIAFWGDSITAGKDQVDINDAYFKKVVNLIESNLPNIDVEYQNFSIGRQTILNANNPNFIAKNFKTQDGSTFWDTWAREGKSWSDHVKEFNPNLLIIAFGMNDSWVSNSDESTAENLNSLLDDISTWPSNPSVVLVPTILPTKDPDKYNQRQDITNSVARSTRAVAESRGVAIADANRLFRILRDGKDELSYLTSKETNWENFEQLWEGDTSYFIKKNEVLNPISDTSNKFIYRSRDFYNGEINLNIIPHAESDHGVTWIRYRQSDLGNMLVLVGAGENGYVRIYSQNKNGSELLKEITPLNIPVEEKTNVSITAQGSVHKVYLNDSEVINITTYKNLHDGGLNLGGNYKVPSFSGLSINYSDPLSGYPLYTEEQLLGKYDNEKESGNGINHPSGFGHNAIYVPAFYGIIKELAR